VGNVSQAQFWLVTVVRNYELNIEEALLDWFARRFCSEEIAGARVYILKRDQSQIRVAKIKVTKVMTSAATSQLF
jgi:hypothetical protein